MSKHAECSVHDVTQASTRMRPNDILEPLVARARRGDDKAERLLLVYLTPAVRRLLRKFCTGAELDDAVQETLLAIHRALRSFRGDSGVLQFARRIALHRALSTRRSLMRRARHLTRLARLEEALADSPSIPLTETLQLQRAHAFRELLARLPRVQAECLIRRVVLDYSLKEVSSATDTPFNTVRTRLRLARETLRHWIATDPAWSELLSPESASPLT